MILNFKKWNGLQSVTQRSDMLKQVESEVAFK